MKPMRTLFIAAFVALSISATAQVTLDPFFAGQDDSITVYYDATQGNGALAGQTTVYAHTGVITTASTGPTDWKFVQGNWGTVDPNVLMTDEGNNVFSISYDIESFYGYPVGTEVLSLAFVFRTADGSIVGRTAAGGDIFVPLYDGYGAVLLNPGAELQIIDQHQTFEVEALASDPSTMRIWVDDSTVAEDNNVTELNYTLNTINFGPGAHYIILEATDGNETILDSSRYLFREPTVYEALPAGIYDGANYINDSTVQLLLTCPIKEFAYVIGDFTNWEVDPNYAMKRSLDTSSFWIEISGLEPGVEYRYQFVVGEDLIRIADPYTHKVLDPWNDPWIPEESYPNLIDYPTGLTNEPVSILEINRPEYPWDTTVQFERPAPTNLRIYELLIRDFTEERTYQSVIDSMAYLKRLGINAIELMPVNEFEGNNSWGYNPSFYFAPDKYYGPEEKLKELIEEAHRNDIAIIIDMVLNHSFGQSPLVRLFFDGPSNNPSADNPWFRQDPAHDFNVGYDMDHESPYTQKFVDDVMRFWVEEYHVDGYRMDLSKGFTNNVTLGNVGAWGQYDETRIDLLTRMGDEVWAIDPSVYIILEHFANNDEEEELSNRGFMLWGNANHDYNENTMGYGASLGWSSYQNRGWDDPHLVSYMESHDEERLMYRNKQYGDAVEGYDTRKTWTALKRMELATVYFLCTPGPKMFWQFGEMGYDLSINRCENGSISEGCRLSPKPPRWNYLENTDRKRLFEVYAAMNHLRETYDVFATTDYSMFPVGDVKSIKLESANMNVATICNFAMTWQEATVTMPHTGTWHEYFTGDSIEVTGTTFDFNLSIGEYRLYTDVRLDTREIPAGIAETEDDKLLIYPNPATEKVFMQAGSYQGSTQVELIDITGRVIQSTMQQSNGSISMDVSNVESGSYLVRVRQGQKVRQEVVIID